MINSGFASFSGSACFILTIGCSLTSSKKHFSYMPASLALMLEIYNDGLKIFRSQEILPVSLETRVQYGGDESSIE
jgi:hypothetical protein